MAGQSLTIAAAIKKVIEAGGLGLTVYRDHPPQNTPYPYVSVQEGIASAPDPNTNVWDQSIKRGIRPQAQVDIWQRWRKKDKGDNTKVEDPTLPLKVYGLLHGRKLTAGDTINGLQCIGMFVRNSVRLLEEDTNVTHEAMTVELIMEI